MTEPVKIVFLLNDDSIHNGGARPLINWASVVPGSILMIFQKKGRLEISSSVLVKSIVKAAAAAKDYNYIIVSDNNLKKGIMLSRRTGAKLLVYCQVPFGLHALGVINGGESRLKGLIYFVIKMIPFRIFVSQYVRRLKKTTLIMANSLNMNILLNFVYGIPDSEIVYPPLEDSKFVPIPEMKKDSILVFVGRNGDLNEYGAFQIIEDISMSYGADVLIFGSAPVPESIYKEYPRFKVHKNISDEELVRLYNRSYATVCIQKQEYFGYVPIESILCGTPSITLYRHDASNVDEYLRKYLVYADLQNLKSEMLKLIDAHAEGSFSLERRNIVSKFASSVSSNKLLKLIKKIE
jgi:hypothetical protein